MVQQFGKRIIGGIGAPGGGMSKAYAEGVNTGINQRMNRQSMSAVDQEMRMREQDQQFKIEDREEAKRQRAAAAANAAAARARNIATIRAIAAAGGAGGAGSYWPGLNVRGAPATRPGALSMGTAVEAPTRTSAGGAVAPTATATPRAKVDVAPRAGLRVNQVPAPVAPAPVDTPEERQRKFNEFMNSRAPDMNISNIENIEFVQGTRAPAGTAYATPSGAISVPWWPVGRPGDFAEQAADRDLTTRWAATAASGAPLTPREAAFQRQFRRGMGSTNVPALQQYRQELEDRIAAETQARQSGETRWSWQGEDLNGLIAEKQLVDAEIAAVQAQPARVGLQTRGMTAEEGPGSTAAGIAAREAFIGPPVTIQGPNGPVTVSTEPPSAYARVTGPTIMPPGALPAGRMDIPVPASPELGFGGAASPPEKTYGGLAYGGQLGAAPTPTEMFFADMGYTPAGQVDIQALMADQTGPIKDPAFSQIAEQERVRYMYAAEDAIANGDAAGFIEAQRQIKTQEMLILAQQVVAGGDEATNFGSTERLNMAASMIKGVDTVFIPNGDGTVDVYVNGQLDDENITIESIIDILRMDVDTAYVEQMAAAAAENRAVELDIYKANRKKAFEADQTMRTTEFESDLISERLELANQLAGELADAGEFNKLTMDLMRESLIRQGLLPADTPELKIQTNPNTGGFVVLDPRTGDPVTQYVPNPNGDGSLVEQR